MKVEAKDGFVTLNGSSMIEIKEAIIHHLDEFANSNKAAKEFMVVIKPLGIFIPSSENSGQPNL